MSFYFNQPSLIIATKGKIMMLELNFKINFELNNSFLEQIQTKKTCFNP
jgi:hypothetical protein